MVLWTEEWAGANAGLREEGGKVPKLDFHPPAIGPKGSKPGSVLCPGKSHLFFRKHNLFEEKVVPALGGGGGGGVSPGDLESGRIYNLNCFNSERYLLAHGTKLSRGSYFSQDLIRKPTVFPICFVLYYLQVN